MAASSNATATDATAAQPIRVLVDTNAVLDVQLAREPWASQAKPLFDARDAGRAILYLPASVLTDIYYICRKQVGPDRAKAIVEECLQRFVVLTVDRTVIEDALRASGPDFEDNVQVICALRIAADIIATRNAQDFAQSPIPAVEPLDIASRRCRPAAGQGSPPGSAQAFGRPARG